MACGVCGGRQANVEDMYAREEVVREAQLEERLAQRFEDNPFAMNQPPRRYPVVRESSRQWESGSNLTYQSSRIAYEFLDWVGTVEKVLEFKDVPLDKMVYLVAAKVFVAWLQQLKQNRVWQGKQKINTWEKLMKHMWIAFLPHNYSGGSSCPGPSAPPQQPAIGRAATAGQPNRALNSSTAFM
ncbi:hypothetical protein Acr_25g0002780 [Actinidia rufa]|uniref:Uncharacterized protein n=1 Tax=Actinidia rufa TaxID=165716 RepID=A0A7J0GYG4_9ERIC|nr:hypothetical protein Acr_25g0002780 [Actinidia rufa]